jgi:hypothetical protein
MNVTLFHLVQINLLTRKKKYFHLLNIAKVLDFFQEMALLATWELWKLRNDKIFNRDNHLVTRWPSNFKNQCFVHLDRFKVDLQSTFCAWLDAFS